MTTEASILLVEDNQDDVILTLRAFKKALVANPIHVVNDGEEALAYLFGEPGKDPPQLPAVILLDLNLPKIDGLTLLRRLRADERTRRLPVVVLTSSREERDIIGSYDLGANSFVRKPVDFDEFVDAARQLGLYWLMFNQPPPEVP
jgi:two-component system, response regulator